MASFLAGVWRRTWVVLCLCVAGCASMRDGDPLPLVELPVAGSHRLAILMTGDGGWRALDKGIAAELNRQGVSVVGWNSRRYFWDEKPPGRVADDLSGVMATYRQRWHADDVALIGYSFGADIMPFAWQGLPDAQRRQVRFVSLLGMSRHADFEVRLGWIGRGYEQQAPIAPVLLQMPVARLQCIHGAKEKVTLCPELAVHGIEVVQRPGGHHFDRDAVKLAEIILQGWNRAPPVP